MYKNERLQDIRFSVTNQENLDRLDQFHKHSHLTPEEIEDLLEKDHTDDHFECWEKVVCCVCCWKSFIHDKHEAFRFKYDVEAMNKIETEIMPTMTYMLYFNALIYYIIMFVCPMMLNKGCGKGLKYTVYYIYAGFVLYSTIFELVSLCRLQALIDNPNVFQLNKWHIVELFFGQIARFDTFMDICFFVLMF